MTGRILLIEDDPRLAEMVQRYLGEAGFDVVIASKGELGIARYAREGFDCIILDLTLPDIDGLDVCRRIRTQAQTPILMLTARGDAMDRVVGLELGADDYLPKPFEPRELLARVKAILRRAMCRALPPALTSTTAIWASGFSASSLRSWMEGCGISACRLASFRLWE